MFLDLLLLLWFPLLLFGPHDNVKTELYDGKLDAIDLLAVMGLSGVNFDSDDTIVGEASGGG